MTEPPLLAPDFLQALDRLEQLVRRLPRRAGRRVEGASGAVRDWRPYRRGDPTRTIDWPAYARLGRLFTRVLETEETRTVELLLDASRSLVAAPAPASRIASREAAQRRWLLRTVAALAAVGLAREAAVGLHAFAGARALVRERPARGPGARDRLFRALEALPFVRCADPPTALHAFVRARLRSPAARRAIAILVTDALWPDGPERPLATLRAAGLDVLLLWVEPPSAAALEGACELEDAETGRRRVVVVDPAVRRAYERVREAHAEAVTAACRWAGADAVRLPRGAPVLAVAQQVLRAQGID